MGGQRQNLVREGLRSTLFFGASLMPVSVQFWICWRSWTTTASSAVSSSEVCIKNFQAVLFTAVLSRKNQTHTDFRKENDIFCDYSLQHWCLFHVYWISDHPAEDSQQSLCKGLQGLRPGGLVSVYTQTIQSYRSVSTWCRNVSVHLQNSFSVYFIWLRCQMGGVYHIKEHTGHHWV